MRRSSKKVQNPLDWTLTLDVEVDLLAAAPADVVGGLAGVSARAGAVDLLHHQALVGQDHSLRGVLVERTVLLTCREKEEISNAFIYSRVLMLWYVCVGHLCSPQDNEAIHLPTTIGGAPAILNSLCPSVPTTY